ncbi:MAG TPA: hypothetical protein VFB29_13600 [Pseudolabrys sp.]|nr:hypothetical protein [Pseudolabrys sp.]
MIVRTPLLVGSLACALLAGCAASGDSAGRLLVQPDRYVLYNCKELAEAAQSISARQFELERLMTRAGTDSSGQLVSDIAYRPEYAQLRGQMNELYRTSAEKNCKPVLEPRTSDHVIR